MRYWDTLVSVMNLSSSWPCARRSRTAACAAISIAGLSRNPSALCSRVNRERASRSSRSLPAHASRRKASRWLGGRCNAACNSLSSCFHCSESIARPAAEFAIKPELGYAPVAPHGGWRHFEYFGRLLNTESAKETHLDDLHLTRIETGQCIHCIIERHQATSSIAGHDGDIVEGDMPDAAPALYVMATGTVDQYAPHHLCRNREEMGPILPFHALVVHQTHIGFIHQGSGLQRVPWALAVHIAVSQVAKLFINNGC